MYAILEVLTGNYLYIHKDNDRAVLYSNYEIKSTNNVNCFIIAKFNTKKQAAKIFTKSYWRTYSHTLCFIVSSADEEYDLTKKENRSRFEIVEIT